MPLTADALRRIVLVAHSPQASFVELVGMAELDRTTAFRRASMRGTDLRSENLAGFDFTDADFTGADVRGTDFRHAVGLTVEMFRNAIVDDTTQWPPQIPGLLPSWADVSGTDQYGRWVSFSVPAADGTPVTQRMRWIPPGHFMMGSPEAEHYREEQEGPYHAVRICTGYWLFETTCSEELWEAVTMKQAPIQRGRKFPVTGVSWQDVNRFCELLNLIKPGLSVQLPSEARWEYACRAGSDTPYSWGIDIDPALARYKSSGPAQVGSFPPNPWGLHEMHGNIWEWCRDYHHNTYAGAPHDGSPWLGRRGHAPRIRRGGMWSLGAENVRSAKRGGLEPTSRPEWVGFRCVQEAW